MSDAVFWFVMGFVFGFGECLWLFAYKIWPKDKS